LIFLGSVYFFPFNPLIAHRYIHATTVIRPVTTYFILFTKMVVQTVTGLSTTSNKNDQKGYEGFQKIIQYRSVLVTTIPPIIASVIIMMRTT
jgi:hypothetical protein